MLPHYEKAKSDLIRYMSHSNVLVLSLIVSHIKDEDETGTSRCIGVHVDSVDGAVMGGSLRVDVPDNGRQPLGLNEVLEWLPDFRIEAATDSYVVLRRNRT